MDTTNEQWQRIAKLILKQKAPIVAVPATVSATIPEDLDITLLGEKTKDRNLHL